jgi:hypothetical protein
MDLAKSQMPNFKKDDAAEHYVPQQMRVPVPGSLIELLYDKYIGKDVEVGVPGAQGYTSQWSGTLKGIAEQNGQLFFYFSDLIIPCHQVRYIKIGKEQ